MAKLFEYHSKELLKKGGILIPTGKAVKTSDEAKKVAEQINGPVVIKAQAWVTGRTQLGGVKFAQKPEEAEKVAGEILGMDLKGFIVKEVLVEENLI